MFAGYPLEPRKTLSKLDTVSEPARPGTKIFDATSKFSVSGVPPRKGERIERLEKLVAAFKQAAFGRKSEKTDPDQFDRRARRPANGYRPRSMLRMRPTLLVETGLPSDAQSIAFLSQRIFCVSKR